LRRGTLRLSVHLALEGSFLERRVQDQGQGKGIARFKVQAKGKGKARDKEREPRVSKGRRAHQGKGRLASRG